MKYLIDLVSKRNRGRKWENGGKKKKKPTPNDSVLYSGKRRGEKHLFVAQWGKRSTYY